MTKVYTEQQDEVNSTSEENVTRKNHAAHSGESSKEKTVFRICKDKDNPYVQINKRLFADKDLSWDAKGVMGQLLSYPDDWEMRFWELISHGPAKECAMRRILKELEARGYMIRTRYRTESGRFKWETRVYESPQEPAAVPEAEDGKKLRLVAAAKAG